MKFSSIILSVLAGTQARDTQTYCECPAGKTGCRVVTLDSSKNDKWDRFVRYDNIDSDVEAYNSWSGNFESFTLKSCTSKCLSSTSCKAFTYVNKGCWLKSKTIA